MNYRKNYTFTLIPILIHHICKNMFSFLKILLNYECNSLFLIQNFRDIEFSEFI